MHPTKVHRAKRPEADRPFDRAFDRLILVEGGYANNPDDPGGQTRYGITEAVARANGYRGSMRELPLLTAKEIYRRAYWTRSRCDELARMGGQDLAEEVFDSAVNAGPGRAALWLQHALNALNRRGADYANILEDGFIGGNTLRAAEAFLRLRGADGRLVLLRALNCLQGAHYLSLAKNDSRFETFAFGWLRTRVTIPGEA